MNDPSLEQCQIQELEQLAEANFFTEFIQTSGISGVELNGRPKDSMQMYIEAAAEALNRIDQFDQSAARILKQVIDFLASDSRLKPEEFDQLRKNNAELTFNLNQLQKRFNITNNDLQLANHRVEDLEEGISNVRKKNAELDCDLETANKHLESYRKQVKELNLRVTEAYTEQLEIKKARDEAVKRQNNVVAQNITQKSNIEKYVREIDSLKQKLQVSQQQEKDLRQKAADMQLRIDDMHLQTQTLKQQLSHVQSQYDSQQTLHNIEMDQLKARVDLVFNEKTELQVQVKSLQDQLAKSQAQLTQLRKHAAGDFVGFLDGFPGGGPAAASSDGPIRGTVAGSAVPQIQTTDAAVQVYQTVRRIKENHEEVVIDDQVSIFDKLNCITAELSETSHNCDYGDDASELHEDDAFDDFLRKVKTQFVKKGAYEALQQRLSVSQRKYQKYKIKYETLSHEITVQGMLKQYHAVDEAIKQLDETMQASGMDSAVASMQTNFKLLRISLETKLLRLEEQITDYVSKINISELKLLVGDRLTRTSRDSLVDEEIRQRAESLKGAPQSVQMMLAGLQELIEEPDRRVQKVEKQMKSQNEVIKTFVKEDKNKKKESAAMKKAVEKAKKIQKVINQKLDLNMANNKFAQTVFKGQDEGIQVKIIEEPQQEAEAIEETPELITEDKFMQTEEEETTEQVDTEAQATVAMLDEEVQMEVVTVETREFGIQTVEKMTVSQQPATAKIKKTYKIITLEKKDMLEVKNAMKQGTTPNSKKKKVKVYTGGAENIPETFRDRFDPDVYALEEVEEEEEAEECEPHHQEVPRRPRGVEKNTQTDEVEVINRSVAQSQIQSAAQSSAQNPAEPSIRHSSSGSAAKSVHEMQTSAAWSTKLPADAVDGATQYSLVLETQQFNADLMEDLDRVDQETNQLLLEKLAEIEVLKKQLQDAIERQQQGLQQVKSRQGSRTQIQGNEQSKSDTDSTAPKPIDTEPSEVPRATQEPERLVSGASSTEKASGAATATIDPSQPPPPPQAPVQTIQGTLTMQVQTSHVSERHEQKLEMRDVAITGGPIHSFVVTPERVESAVQIEQILGDTSIQKCNQSLQTSLQDMSAIIQKQMSKRSNIIKSQKAALEEHVQSVRMSTIKALPDVSSILETTSNRTDLRLEELSVRERLKTPILDTKAAAGDSADVDDQNVLDDAPAVEAARPQSKRPPRGPEGQQNQQGTEIADFLPRKPSLVEALERYRELAGLSSASTQTDVKEVKYADFKLQTESLLLFDKEVQSEVQLQDLFVGGGANQEYVKQQFKLLTDEKERFRQQGIQLQTQMEELRDRLEKLNREKKLQASVIAQINAQNQLKPRSRGDDKQCQTEATAAALDGLGKQLLLLQADTEALIAQNEQLKAENRKLSKTLKEVSGEQLDADVLQLVNAQYRSYQPVAELSTKSVLDSNILDQNIYQQLKEKRDKERRERLEKEGKDQKGLKRGNSVLKGSFAGSFTGRASVSGVQNAPNAEAGQLEGVDNTRSHACSPITPESPSLLTKSTVNKFTKKPVKQPTAAPLGKLQRPALSSVQDAKKMLQEAIKPQITQMRPLGEKTGDGAEIGAEGGMEISAESGSEVDGAVLRRVREQRARQAQLAAEARAPRRITEEQLKTLLVTLQYKQQEADFAIPRVRAGSQAGSLTGTGALGAALAGSSVASAGAARPAALQKLRVLEQALVPEISQLAPPSSPQQAAITVKCKKPRQIRYKIDQNGKYTFLVDGAEKKAKSRPLVREYVFRDNRFISPFAEALEIREQNRKKKQLNSQGNRNGDIRMLSLLDYDETKYLEPPRRAASGVERRFQEILGGKAQKEGVSRPESQFLRQVRAGSVAAVEQETAGERPQQLLWLLPAYDGRPAPSAINQKETALFARHGLAAPYAWARLRLVGEDLTISALKELHFEEGEINSRITVLGPVHYAEVEADSYFNGVFTRYCQYPVVTTAAGRHFVKLPPNCQLKPFAVILKTIKLFYYENDSGHSFLEFLEKKFMNKLMVGRFIAQFYVGLIYYLHDSGQKREEIIELQLFQYFVIAGYRERQKQREYLGVRRLLSLDRENPTTCTLERLLQANVETIKFTDKKTELRNFIKKAITNVPGTSLGNFTLYLMQFDGLTYLQLLYVISQLNSQLSAKKYARYLAAYDSLGVTNITMEQLINILDANIGYLSYDTIKTIIEQQYGSKKQFDLTDFINVASQFTQINMQKDDILSECVKKFQLCEELMKNLIDLDEIKDIHVLEQLQDQRNQIQIKIGQRNGLIGLLYCNQYYDSIQKIYKQKVVKQDDSIQLEIVKTQEESPSALRRNTTETQQFESIDV